MSDQTFQATFRHLCGIFCCPPFPSRITAKLAFHPPVPSYTFLKTKVNGQETLSLLFADSRWLLSRQELETIDIFFWKTARGNDIACMFFRCVPQARYTILYSHGNAQDQGQLCDFFLDLGSLMKCNILSYDYSGYGSSNGKPSEKNIYKDIDAAFDALQIRYGISPSKILLYGQSIGTVPSVDLASRRRVGGVILHSPLMSGIRMIFPDIKKTWCIDAFPNIDKVARVTSPLLVIHGTSDSMVDISHGLAIFKRCPNAVEPLWLDGADHNDNPLYDNHEEEYIRRLRRFVAFELDYYVRNRAV